MDSKYLQEVKSVNWLRAGLLMCVCFFVLCNRHWFNRVPDPPPRDRLGVTYLPFTISSDAWSERLLSGPFFNWLRDGLTMIWPVSSDDVFHNLNVSTTVVSDGNLTVHIGMWSFRLAVSKI